MYRKLPRLLALRATAGCTCGSPLGRPSYHRVIVAGLHALTPAIPVLSEEASDIAFAVRKTWSRYWLVDPLDGTKEFLSRSEWDTAAAQAVVEAAGGAVTTIEGAPLRYNTKESLLNPAFMVSGDPQTDWKTLLGL